jgi:hypothetical protein
MSGALPVGAIECKAQPTHETYLWAETGSLSEPDAFSRPAEQLWHPLAGQARRLEEYG